MTHHMPASPADHFSCQKMSGSGIFIRPFSACTFKSGCSILKVLFCNNSGKDSLHAFPFLSGIGNSAVRSDFLRMRFVIHSCPDIDFISQNPADCISGPLTPFFLIPEYILFPVPFLRFSGTGIFLAPLR